MSVEQKGRDTAGEKLHTESGDYEAETKRYLAFNSIPNKELCVVRELARHYKLEPNSSR